MNPWSVLGIGKTIERKEVKRAYARCITLCHPEDNASGFKKIRQAYEMALEEIALFEKVIETESSPPPVKPAQAIEPLSQSEQGNGADGENAPFAKIASPLATSLEVFKQAELLLEDPDRRYFAKHWTVLLNNEAFENIEVKMLFSDKLFKALSEALKNENKPLWIPSTVWKVIDERLNWRRLELRFYKQFDESTVNLVFDSIHDAFKELEPFQLKAEKGPSGLRILVTSYLFLVGIVFISRLLPDNNSLEKSHGRWRFTEPAAPSAVLPKLLIPKSRTDRSLPENTLPGENIGQELEKIRKTMQMKSAAENSVDTAKYKRNEVLK